VKHFLHSVITSLALLTMVGAPGVVQAEVVLVGSSNIHFSEISKTKLRDLYTGQSQAVGDSTVLVIDRDDEFGERSRFISGTLGFTTEEFRTVQRLLECIGISKAPTVARDSQHMVELLANNPNALGYLTRKELQGNPTRSKLKLIKVLAE
jgi:ABC-type phosphate transport system substrate-binding protein